LKSRKLRKFTDESRSRRSPPPENYENSQTKRTRKHETTKIAMNSAQSLVRHLDLATPAFYHYRKNPKCYHCYHTVWGKKEIASCGNSQAPKKWFKNPSVKRPSCGQIHKCNLRKRSMVVSSSLNRWQVPYNPPIGSIYHLYTTYILPIGWLYGTDPTY